MTALRARYDGACGAVWPAAYLAGPLSGTRLLAAGAPLLWLTCAGDLVAQGHPWGASARYHDPASHS